MKIAGLQWRSIVGSPQKNGERLIQGYLDACKQGADLVVTPELYLSGYSSQDLFTRKDFLIACEKALQQIMQAIGEIPLIVGTPRENRNAPCKSVWNAAVVLQNKKIVHEVHKTLLPAYSVFNEERYFERGQGSEPFQYKGRRIGITICEDIWNVPEIPDNYLYTLNPVQILQDKGADGFINLSASPWYLHRETQRWQVVQSHAQKTKAPWVYVNVVGGYDEILFDGQSMACDAAGNWTAFGKAFEEDILWADWNASSTIQLKEGQKEEMYDKALEMGFRDYLSASGFKKVLLGLSGGIDSALTAALAVKAIGAENVMGVAMPSKYSSKGSIADAEALAHSLGIEFHISPIQEMVDQFLRQMEPLFQGKPQDVTEENAQARIRGLTLMALSNKTGRLLLTTGNKSEVGVGYCTLYGDMCGGLNLIGDLWKTEVYALARWINREKEIIPRSSIEKAPSAELRQNQTDQDSLPPYDILDAILEKYIVQGRSIEEIIGSGYEAAIVRDVTRKVDNSEYKRKQAAPILRVSRVAFGVGRLWQIHHFFHQR